MPSHSRTRSKASRHPATAASDDSCSDLDATGPEDQLVEELETLRGQIAATSEVIQKITEQNGSGHGFSLLQSEHDLRCRLEFEKFLFDLSRTFIGLPEQEVDVNMERGLARVGEFLQMDRVTLLELSLARTELSVA